MVRAAHAHLMARFLHSTHGAVVARTAGHHPPSRALPSEGDRRAAFRAKKRAHSPW